MQREIEVKVLNIDVEKMKKKLSNLGADYINHEYQKNYTFIPKDKSSFETGYLRIREATNADTNEKQIYLTFKEISTVDDVRINNEYTTKIDSITMMSKILDKLGVELEYKGEKERFSYLYKSQRFDIDIWDENTYPNPYMEIEFTNQTKIDEILDELQINRKNVTTKSITELREEINLK